MPKHGRPSSRSADDFLYNSPLSAPFGTLFSQPLNVRIVGGKYVPTRKSDITYQPGKVDLSLLPSNDSGDPQTNRSQALFNSSNAEEKADLLEKSASGNSTINRHPVLPAIGSHRAGRADERHVGGTLVGEPVDICDVYDKLPRDSMVSVEPLMLTGDEELVVMQEIKRELEYLDHSLLNTVYADLQRFDPNMSGYVPFQDLRIVLSKNHILLPSRLLRLVASMFVSRIEQGSISYIRILNFVTNAINGIVPQNPPPPEPINEDHKRLNLNTTYGNSFEKPLRLQEQYQAIVRSDNGRFEAEAQRQSPHLPQSQSPQNYYQMAREDWAPSPPELSPRGDTQRALRQLEGRLPTSMDLESLRHAFQRADRYHRGTLSEVQIREICAECLRLDRVAVNLLIGQIPPRGGGQYNWQSFIDLLERVQPVRTGLYIPDSKRPLEYALPMRQPASSWPAPDPSPSPHPIPQHQHQHQQPASHRSHVEFFQPPVRQPQYQPESEPPRLAPVAPQDAIPPPAMHREDTFRSDDLNNYPTAPNYLNPSGVIRPMETKYPNPLSLTSEPWHNRFMKLAEAIYRNDRTYVGQLDQDRLRRITEECNSCYDLNLSDGTIADAVSRNRKGTEVNIHGFLMALAVPH